MTTDISPQGLMAAYAALHWTPQGNVAVKLSTGEAGNNYYLSPRLIEPLVAQVKGTIIECNTAYDGARAKTDDHCKVAHDHGFTAIADVDIMDAEDSSVCPFRAARTLRKTSWARIFCATIPAWC